MTNREAGSFPQPLSGMDYAKIGAILLLLGIVLLLGFAFLSPRLLPAGLSDQFFYVVLLLWGLVCAMVLFGVMRSYARLTVRKPGILLELGGPVVVACLVVFGGFKLVPRQGTFNVTVRPHAVDAPVITSGKIRLEYGDNPAIRDLDSNGEADFKQIPREYWGAKVRVLPQVDGYSQEFQFITLDKNAIDLTLAREKPETTLKGKIIPPPRKGQVVRVLVEGEDGEAGVDEYGRFALLVHHKNGESIRLSVYVNNKQLYDGYQTLPGPVTLSISK
jgi:hypothetical protein